MNSMIRKLFLLSLATVMPCFPMEDQESGKTIFSKSGASSHVATAGVFAAGYFGTNILMNKVMQNNPLNPYIAGTLTALALLKWHGTLHEYFYTLFSGDIERLNNNLEAIKYNKEQIQEIVKEISYVHGQIVKEITNHYDKKQLDIAQKFAALLQPEQFAKQVSSLLKLTKPDNEYNDIPASLAQAGGDLLKVLNKTKELRPKSDISDTYSHWFGGMKDTWKLLAWKYATIKDWIVRDDWDFIKDDRLLVTWGGPSLEDAAKKLFEAVRLLQKEGWTHLHNPITAEMYLNDFSTNAKMIVDYAESTICYLKSYEDAIKRIADAVKATNNIATTDFGAHNNFDVLEKL